jgi:hypothetical protein
MNRTDARVDATDWKLRNAEAHRGIDIKNQASGEMACLTSLVKEIITNFIETGYALDG